MALATSLAAGCAAAGSTATHQAATTAAAPAPATQAPAPQADPNGQQCASLDSLGYCPGDDPASTPAATTPMQAWCGSIGYSDFQTVESDLSQLGTDSANNDLSAVESDGTTQFQDATAASHDPNFLPPLSNAHKVGYLMVAGYKSRTGDISGATSALEQASKYTSITQYISNQCGGTS
jgi:hypothetical protein